MAKKTYIFNSGRQAKVLAKFLFLWEGNFDGDNLANKNGTDSITVTGKDFVTTYIPATSNATFKIPLNGLIWLGDPYNLWHDGIYQKNVVVSDMLRVDYSTTIIEYENSSPYNIKKIGILDPQETITDKDKKFLTKYFKLHKYFWGANDSNGQIKDNRSSEHLETTLLNAHMERMNGDILELVFNKEISATIIESGPPSFTVQVKNVIVKKNGSPIDLYVNGGYAPWRFFNLDSSPICTKDDILTVSITGDSDFIGADGVAFNTVTDFPITISIPEEFNVLQVSPQITQRPHGTIIANNKLFLGHRTNPVVLTRFNDIDDLTDYDQITINEYNTAETLTFDGTNIYFLSRFIETDTVHLLRLNPTTLEYSYVMSFGFMDVSFDPQIVNDGEYIYIIGGNTIYKINISTLEITSNYLGGNEGGHTLALHKYNDNHVELYSQLGGIKFIKIQGSDLSYETCDLFCNDWVTDDGAFQYIDETGGYYWGGNELNDYAGYKIDTRTMSVETFPCVPHFGSWMAGNDAIYTGSYGIYVRFPNGNINTNPVVKIIPRIYGTNINELFYIDNRIFVTNFDMTFCNLMEISEIVPELTGEITSEDTNYYLTNEDSNYYLQQENI